MKTLSVAEAYRRRNEYQESVRPILIHMMHRERLHRLWMKTPNWFGRRRIMKTYRKVG